MYGWLGDVVLFLPNLWIFYSQLNSNMHQGGFAQKICIKEVKHVLSSVAKLHLMKLLLSKGVHMDHTTWHVVNLIKSVDSNRTWHYLLFTHKISYSTSMHCKKLPADKIEPIICNIIITISKWIYLTHIYTYLYILYVCELHHFYEQWGQREWMNELKNNSIWFEEVHLSEIRYL